MPFQIVDPETDTVGPFNRLSSSQINTWNACKRMWFYQKRLRFKIGQIPKLFLGRAVEETFCRVNIGITRFDCISISLGCLCKRSRTVTIIE